MQTDGNLVIYGNSQAIWASGTAGNPGAFLQVQDDGNVVIYSSMGQPLWTTSTVSVSTLPLGTWRAAAPSTSTSSPSAPCNNNVMDEYDFATNRKVSRRGIYSCGGNMTYEEDTGNAIVQGSTIMIKITSSKESTYLGSRQLIDQGPLHPYSVTYKWTLQTNGTAQLAFTPYCPNCLIAQPIYYTKVIK
ncbi:MAG: hypothetical protein JO235_12985 [Chroococcidiopsidaceae cyanobacterium CP_BM_RX_35]|nr:hypothetical protein [Chroococcidiopsidaceae cyanobacterium CP_BM_RX_35]